MTLAQACPALLMRVFTREAGVAGVGIGYLRTVSLVYPFTAVFFVLSGVLRGAGACGSSAFPWPPTSRPNPNSACGVSGWPSR